ncbi:MAG: hypothetical protein RL734_1126, partial [Bacteroidota bacterium]
MKLITFQPAPSVERLGFLLNDRVFDIASMRDAVQS